MRLELRLTLLPDEPRLELRPTLLPELLLELLLELLPTLLPELLLEPRFTPELDDLPEPCRTSLLLRGALVRLRFTSDVEEPVTVLLESRELDL